MTPKRKAHGSERRQRQKALRIRFDDGERARVELKAAGAGLSLAAYGRACMLDGNAGPRARRSPNINRAALGAAVGALNKIGSNINQLAREQNSGTTPHARALVQALEDVRQTLAVLRTAAGYASNDP